MIFILIVCYVSIGIIVAGIADGLENTQDPSFGFICFWPLVVSAFIAMKSAHYLYKFGVYLGKESRK